MPFISLTPYNFRNLSNCPIDLSSREVFFIGENGQGKSNLLESLYYSAYGSSFRTHLENEIIYKGQSEMSVHSMYREDNGITHTTLVSLKGKNKKIEKDGKMVHDRKELVNTMPCVLYSHDDLDFAAGSPERRRFFIDQSLSMYDVMYIDLIRKYKRILKNRNLCLKDNKVELLDAYDVQLIQTGLEIQKKRKDAVFKFNQIFGDLYFKVTDIDGLSIKYSPSWKKRDENHIESNPFADSNIPSVENILEHVRRMRQQELIMGTTMSGPHRDRIEFEVHGNPFIPTASTGQRRMVALVLRTAQAVYYRDATGKNPVLLMDDVMLEVDPEKRKKITALLPKYDQLFCTFLPGEPYENYVRENTFVYEIKSGTWTRKQ
ncbi:MAG: DNA replication and repair protein RecF [Treponema sp.]|nr:DNA replication and repair protein RecF [Treponema sp.]